MNKQSLTIGIPAYNEEVNIESLLRSLLNQSLSTLKLFEILVYSDASSDKTDKIVTSLNLKYPLIKLIQSPERKGKYHRVNELFRHNTSDILVILDADIALSDSLFLERLTSALLCEKNAVMMSADVTLIRPKTTFAKILHTSFVLSDFMRLSVPGYDIAPNFHGAATAYKKSFVETVFIPNNLTDPHLFIYLSAKKYNGFRYCRDAIIYQYPPNTIQDVKRLMKRSIGKKDLALESLFGKEMIQQVHVIPRRFKLLGIWKCFLWQPIYTPLAIFISFYLGRVIRPDKVDLSPVWDINLSSKKHIEPEAFDTSIRQTTR